MKDLRGIDFIKKYWNNNQYTDITCETDPDFDCAFFETIGRLMDDFLIEKTCGCNKQQTDSATTILPDVSDSDFIRCSACGEMSMPPEGVMVCWNCNNHYL